MSQPGHHALKAFIEKLPTMVISMKKLSIAVVELC
jgi:hypothetical protein